MTESSTEPVTGSCLCGEVRYAVTRFAKPASHCHCVQCRKSHGAAFGTYGVAVEGGFSYTAGAHLVRDFESSDSFKRSFCSVCGSSLTFRPHVGEKGVAVALGTVDGNPGIQADQHIFADNTVPWFEFSDDLPRKSGY